MEQHFLSHQVEGEPEFSARPWFNRTGDCIVCKTVDEASVPDEIDEVLTVYRSAIDNRPIGWQINGATALLSILGTPAVSSCRVVP